MVILNNLVQGIHTVSAERRHLVRIEHIDRRLCPTSTLVCAVLHTVVTMYFVESLGLPVVGIVEWMT
jgi:hypothetical protein